VIRRGEGAPPLRDVADGTYLSQVRCYAPCHNGGVVGTVERGPTGAWFWYEGYGTFHISGQLDQITVYSDNDCDDDRLGLMLCGPITVGMLHMLHVPSLHASAVSTARGAVAFLGVNGRGKSTMAAYFLRRGATLLSDDVLPLWENERGFAAGPGLPLMKLWPEAVECALQVSDDLPSVATNQQKKLVTLNERYPFAEMPLPLRAVYVVDRYDALSESAPAIEISSVRGHDRLMALFAHTSHKEVLLSSEQQRLLAFYSRLVSAIPVRTVRYPSGFEHQARVYEQVLRDLGDL
jgi:hypothetical protein